MKNKGNKFITPLLILIFLAGLSLLLYPTVSDYWNSLHQSRVYSVYMQEVVSLEQYEYDDIRNAAHAYNQALLNREVTYWLSEEEMAQYNQLLNVSGSGIMGRIEIPKLNCTMPIYHGADERVLQNAIGHLEWSSLPVGGESTHCVLSGHRGLPSAKLFTDLDDLVIGDRFMLEVLEETLTYEVDQILTVEPQDTDSLLIVEGEDYCTLVTCTPYGINTHRLLVRGHRVDTSEETKSDQDIPEETKNVQVASETTRVEPVRMAFAVVVPILLLIVVLLLLLLQKPVGKYEKLPPKYNKRKRRTKS